MAQASIAVDIHQSLDIQLDFFAKITFDSSLILDNLADLSGFLLGEIFNQRIDVDSGLIQNRRGA